MKLISKWKTINEEKAADLIIFDAVFKERLNPQTGQKGKFIVLDSPNWVNIVPVTKEGKIVMVQQYRQGTDEITLELPGGLIERDEQPFNAAMRECIEETGYEGRGEAIQIGMNRPNPAYQTNKCYTFLWQDCELKFDQKLDTHEDINILEYTEDQIKELIKHGKIDHCVILTALFFYFMHKNTLK